MGPSGAGKTTLVKLLVGLYRPKSGHIYYNGTAEDEVDIEGLRERIGFVTQDAQLFSGSIRENLRFVRPDATDEECLQVLRQASVESLLARADRGLDTVIGEGGVKVSGGEKQRLSIARALLAQAAIAGVRRGHFVARFADRGRNQPDHSRGRGQPRRDHLPDRAPPVDRAACRSHLRAGARPHRRVRPPRRTAGRTRASTTRCGASRWAKAANDSRCRCS